MRTILIIDDNPGVCEALSLLFSLHDIHALTASSPEAGLELLGCEPVSLVVADMNFTADTTAGAEGAALFHAIRARNPDLPVILLTAWTDLATAVELVKAGAADYLAKPWDDAWPRSKTCWSWPRQHGKQRRVAPSATAAASSWPPVSTSAASSTPPM